SAPHPTRVTKVRARASLAPEARGFAFHSGRPSRPRLVPVHRRTMRVRQEGVHGVADRVEAYRVRAALRRDAFQEAHRLGIEDVDDAGLADCDIEMPERGVEEDDIRHATDRMLTPNGSAPRGDHEALLASDGAAE